MDERARARVALAIYATFGPDHGSFRSAADSLGISEAELCRLLLQAASALPMRERVILCMRLGLGGEPPVTLQAAGDALGETREGIRQIEASALHHLTPDWQRMLCDDVLVLGLN